MGRNLRVQLTETLDPASDEHWAEHRLFQLFLCDLQLQLVPCFLQRFQPGFGRLCQNALLDGIQHVFDGGFRFLELLLQQRHRGVFLFLEQHDAVHNSVHCFVVPELVHELRNNIIFDLLLLHRLFMAFAPVFLSSRAFVIVVHRPVVTAPTLPAQHRAAIAAD